MTCKICNKTLIKKPNESPKYFARKKYCSRGCYGEAKKLEVTGKQNNFWKGGSLRWHKAMIKIRDNYMCKECGINNPEVLVVDHIIPIAVNPGLKLDMNNMVTICANCHLIKTNRERKARLWKAGSKKLTAKI